MLKVCFHILGSIDDYPLLLFQNFKGRRRSSRNPDGDEESSSDSELNEFYPTPGPAVDAALSHASRVIGATPSSSCLGTPTYGFVGGLIPRGGSVEFTDDGMHFADILITTYFSFGGCFSIC